ncbi:PadR family transcriptional regulator [Raoultibacter massiliensis]|uniref:PadR family transcriptional regulator n=1 Tax=Raoultibacter massiliensis TaxID=1852371 RepID=UPI003A8E98A5
MASESIELMILGALMDRPMSAYEMDKEMDIRNVRRWIRISPPSVYRNLIRLYEEGCADGKVVKEGEMPEKTIYSITEKGKERLHELMHRTAAQPARVDYGFLPVTANLCWIGEVEGRELIAELIESHRATAERVEGMIPDYDRLEARATMDLCARTYRLVADWLEEYEREFYDGGKKAAAD